MKEQSKHYKVTYTVNPDTKQIKLTFRPELDYKNVKDIQVFLNTVYTGTYMSLKTLLAGTPMLRPASEEERNAKIYVFKDSVKDNKLYSERKKLYDGLAEAFNNILKEMFPDIEYIENCRIQEQHNTFDMSEDEAEERRLEVADVVDRVKNTPETPVDAIGDVDGDDIPN
jgi:hypothetical protein